MNIKAIVVLTLVVCNTTSALTQDLPKFKSRNNRQFVLQRQEYFRQSPSAGIDIYYRAYVEVPVSIQLLASGMLVESKAVMKYGKRYHKVEFDNIQSGTYTCALVSAGRILDKMIVRVVDR